MVDDFDMEIQADELLCYDGVYYDDINDLEFAIQTDEIFEDFSYEGEYFC